MLVIIGIIIAIMSQYLLELGVDILYITGQLDLRGSLEGLLGNAQEVRDIVHFGFSWLGLYVMPEITEAILAVGQSNFGYFVTWDNKLSYCLSLLSRTVKNILTDVPSKGTQGLVKAIVRLNHVWN